MSEKEPETVYEFTPQVEGAYLRNVPKRDLTQADVDQMTPEQRRDAFAPHPEYGTPLYTAVSGAKVEDYSKVNDALEQAAESYPKWFQDKLDKANAEGTLIPLVTRGETQRAYEERVAASATTEE